MKPIAVINTSKLSDTDIDQPKKLHEAGYVVIYANDGPAILLHQAGPGRRERIATQVLAALVSNGGTKPSEMVQVAVTLANFLITELDKKP